MPAAAVRPPAKPLPLLLPLRGMPAIPGVDIKELRAAVGAGDLASLHVDGAVYVRRHCVMRWLQRRPRKTPPRIQFERDMSGAGIAPAIAARAVILPARVRDDMLNRKARKACLSVLQLL